MIESRRGVAMDLRLFDANVFLGRPTNSIHDSCSTPQELLARMDRFPVERALVWHVIQHDCCPVEGNRLLAEEIKGCDRLQGCWTILPPQTGETIGTDFFERMKRDGIVALRAFPSTHRYVLGRTAFGDFLAEITERRIPLLLSTARGISWPEIYRLLEDFPLLTCIICDIGTWGANRYTWPLLEKYPRVYVETSMLSLADGDTEATVGKYGSERLVFGTGFPERYPEAAILQLIHAEISDEDKSNIAWANLERLLGQIQL